ncbi:hypothetical protein J2X65_005189 [Ancylobacter sp. 3268]|uniref:hypothetical protein n=1 Tax=Ancylobacter sp. 3268 TaxID=2817752 RepID=UPI0028593F81|nr:hypothetical protein [Ancylobacter sp. 3268]MDR6955806.1 hypothetical protein [Ancylobacter sp. 3268]
MTRALDRLMLGALAGFAATLPMTFFMRRLHAQLPAQERYPLPPREISEDLPRLGLSPAAATLLYHFLYGGAAGALYSGLFRHRGLAASSVFGVAVWAASYLGWIPAARILRFGAKHPARRNELMLAAHLAWGASLAAGLRELEEAKVQSFSGSMPPRPVLEDRVEDIG